MMRWRGRIRGRTGEAASGWRRRIACQSGAGGFRGCRRASRRIGAGNSGWRSKRGSFAVYAAIFFVSLASLSVLFLEYSKSEAVKGAGAECGLICAGSILGEYDRNLAERYGIYGYYGSPGMVEEKLDFYMQYMTENKRYLSYEGSEASISSYVLTDPTVFRKQIIAMEKLVKAGEWKDRFLSVGETKKTSGSSTGESVVTAGSPSSSNAVINNESVLHTLPSYGVITGSTWKNPKELLQAAKNCSGLKDLLLQTGEAWLIDEYALHFFQDARQEKSVGNTYFTNEIEYILAGKNGDEANRKAIMRRIVAVREVCNLAYLESSPEMQEKIHTVAALLAPAAEPAVAQLLAAGWALAESYNDYQLLLRGKQVPLWKDADSWALSLEQILTESEGDGDSTASNAEEEANDSEANVPEMKEQLDFVVDPGNERGETYEEYLQFLLSLMKESVKLYRMMDLMQVNMQWNYSKYFFLKDHYAGVAGVLKVNGDAIGFQKEYQA